MRIEVGYFLVQNYKLFLNYTASFQLFVASFILIFVKS